MLVFGEGDFHGEPFRLDADQRLFLWQWYEYDPGSLSDDGEAWVAAFRAGESPDPDLRPEPPKWRYRETFKCEPKGAGKTQLCAAVGMLEFAGPPVIAPKSPNVPIAAASFEQADELFSAAQIMAGGPKGAPVDCPLSGLFEVFDTEILFADGRPGRLFRIAAQAGTKDGGKPTLFVADEIHEWTGNKARLHTVIANSIMKRRRGRVLNLSTVGAGKFSTPPKDTDPLWWKMYTQCQEALQYPDRHPRFLPWLHQASDHWDLDDPDQLRSAIREASRAAVDVLWDLEDRAARWSDPKVPHHEFRRYFLNQPTDADEDSWLQEHPGAWADCKSDTPLPDGAPIGIAVDMALRHDSVAVVWGAEIDGEWVVRSRVFAAGSGKIDHLEVWKFIRSDLARQFKVQWIAYDPRFFELPARMLEEEGFSMVEFPQSPERMTPACSFALEEIINSRVGHDGDPILAAHVNAGARREYERGFSLSKSRSKGHIDACVAMVMLLWTLAEPPPEDSESVYETRGMVTL